MCNEAAGSPWHPAHRRPPRPHPASLRAAAAGHMLAAAMPAHAHHAPSGAQSRASRSSAALCMMACCSTEHQPLGAVGRCIGPAAGASCTIRKHSACSHQPPRSAPPTCTPRPQPSTCSARKRRWALKPSARHHRHAIQLTEGPHTTCCQPPCCQPPCSLLAAAMPAHAHHAPSGAP